MSFTHNAPLADFFHGLASAVGSLSYELRAAGGLVPPANTPNPQNAPLADFAHAARERLLPLVAPRADTKLTMSSPYDTWVFPTIQAGYLGIRHDEFITSSLLGGTPQATLHLSSAYFNFTKEYSRVVLDPTYQTRIHIITATPMVHILSYFRYSIVVAVDKQNRPMDFLAVRVPPASFLAGIPASNDNSSTLYNEPRRTNV